MFGKSTYFSFLLAIYEFSLLLRQPTFTHWNLSFINLLVCCYQSTQQSTRCSVIYPSIPPLLWHQLRHLPFDLPSTLPSIRCSAINLYPLFKPGSSSAMSPKTCLVVLALALMALECAPAAINTSPSRDPHRVARATVSTSCSCGKKLTGNRIVGGQETNISEYPWQAALKFPNGDLLCGGSLITDRHVITAAHCVKDITASEMKVVLKEHNLQLPSETRIVTRGVSSITVHSQYNSVTEENDIAMLALDSPVVVSAKLLPVCLPSDPTLTYAGETATVTGWGDTSQGGSLSNVLKEVDVPVLSHASCKKKTNYTPSDIKRTMLCAGAMGKDSCQGDSGGPLVFLNAKGRYDQIGVVSKGFGCAQDGYPGVYTRVTKYLKWIKSMTKSGTYCSAA